MEKSIARRNSRAARALIEQETSNRADLAAAHLKETKGRATGDPGNPPPPSVRHGIIAVVLFRLVCALLRDASLASLAGELREPPSDLKQGSFLVRVPGRFGEL
jgi:hypothetical protein